MWKHVQCIMQERERLSAELEILGAEVFASSTNFLLVRSKTTCAADELRDKGIAVMDLSNQLGPGFIRIAVGKPENNDALIEAYRSLERGSQ
jgi:histidinol-phosphate aminotransferase